MYFTKVEIENVGPIDLLQIEFPKISERPAPIIIVGENGSGKTILISHLVNSLICGQQEVYEDTEVEKGKVYKYRSPNYVMSGANYSFASVSFDSDISVREWQLRANKRDFEEAFRYTPARKEWSEIGDNSHNHITHNFSKTSTNTLDLISNQCCLYFPVNRFEEPAWLNIDNLRSRASYTELKRISGYSNRNIVCTSPLKHNINWILDLVFDRQAFELRTTDTLAMRLGSVVPVSIRAFEGFQGKSTSIYDAVNQILKLVLRSEANLRLGIGDRKDRKISVMKDEKMWIPNLFQLSTGETQLLNLFLSIIRDYDFSEGNLNTLDDIKGIVIIDEIDAHLHTIHQKEVLPNLIKTFPNVQFIITTHSPLFLLGMEDKFGGDGFYIFNMPQGSRISANDFSEFTVAYQTFRETTRHREEIQREIEKNRKPIVFVEGDYDIRFIKRAAELLGREALLEMIHLCDGEGFGNLDKIWRNYDNPMSDSITEGILLLYDCDTNKKDAVKNRVYKRVIPSISENPIEIGIENLFSAKLINEVEKVNPKFIDIHEETSRRVRGEIIISPAKRSINKDEKGSMCDWICANGTADDFSEFSKIFEIIEVFLRL